MGAMLSVHHLQNQIESCDFTARNRAVVKNVSAHVKVVEHAGGGEQLHPSTRRQC